MKKENESAVERAEMRMQCTDILQAQWELGVGNFGQIRRLRATRVLAFTLLSVRTYVYQLVNQGEKFSHKAKNPKFKFIANEFPQFFRDASVIQKVKGQVKNTT